MFLIGFKQIGAVLDLRKANVDAFPWVLSCDYGKSTKYAISFYEKATRKHHPS